MRVTVIPEDRTILIDGAPLVFDFAADPAIHAIQWHGNHGEIERVGGSEHISDVAIVQPYIDARQAERVRLDALAAAAQAAYDAADAVKARARLAIEVEQDRQLTLGVSWNGKQWHADPVFQAQLTALISAHNANMLQPNDTVPVRGRDDSNNLLNLADLKALAAVVMAYVQQVYTESWAAKDAL